MERRCESAIGRESHGESSWFLFGTAPWGGSRSGGRSSGSRHPVPGGCQSSGMQRGRPVRFRRCPWCCRNKRRGPGPGLRSHKAFERPRGLSSELIRIFQELEQVAHILRQHHARDCAGQCSVSDGEAFHSRGLALQVERLHFREEVFANQLLASSRRGSSELRAVERGEGRRGCWVQRVRRHYGGLHGGSRSWVIPGPCRAAVTIVCAGGWPAA